MSGSNVSNIEETNNQILNDIQNLQSMEQEMFSNLEENPTLTQAQQQAIIQNINQISSMRLSLYQTLTGVTGYFQNSLYNSQGTLKEQTTAIDIVEDELNRAKEKLRLLEEEKNNQVKLIEINTYYGEKYQEHAMLMKIIIFTLVPIIILAILHNKGLIPNIIYYTLLIIIAAVGGYFMWYRIASIWNRDNMNYQEYNWPVYTPPKESKKKKNAASGDPWQNGITGNFGSLGCVDQYCCAPGTTFDGSLNQCVINTSAKSVGVSASGGGGTYGGGGGTYGAPSGSIGGVFGSFFSSLESDFQSLEGGSSAGATGGPGATGGGGAYSSQGASLDGLCNNFSPSPNTPMLNQLCGGNSGSGSIPSSVYPAASSGGSLFSSGAYTSLGSNMEGFTTITNPTPTDNSSTGASGSGSGALESYVNLNDVYTKHSRFTKKADVTLNSNYQPKEAESFINYK